MTALPGPAPARRGLPGVLVIMVLALTVTAAEVAVILQTGRVIGPWWTVALLLAMGFVGAWLWRREGVRAWRALSGAFGTGRMPAGELLDAALVLVGGVLLMLPGFLTDIVGVFFLLPFTRPVARRFIAAVVARTAAKRGLDLGVLRAKAEPDTVIRSQPGDIRGDVTEPAGRAAPSDVIVTGEVLP